MKRSFLRAIALAFVCLLSAARQAQAQTVYSYCEVGYDSQARYVYGYAATYLDYYAASYYDPEVYALLTYENTEIALDEDYGYGYGTYPAEVFLYSGFYRPLTTYYTISAHFVRSVIPYDYYYDYWYDPYGFSFAPGGSIYGGYHPWYSNFYDPYYYLYGRRRVVARLYVGITTPPDYIPPPPTPTPNPQPQITGIDPPNWALNSTVTVTITGTNFGTNPSVQVSGNGITVSLLSASNTQIVANFAVAASADLGDHQVTVVSGGYGGNGFTSGSGGMLLNSNSVTFNVEYPNANKGLNYRELSTGDSAQSIGVTIFNSPNITVEISFAPQLIANLGGKSNATLTIPTVSGRSRVTTTLKAGPNGSSGKFNVALRANGILQPPQNGFGVVVPPQILLQMMRNEARGLRSESVQRFLGWAFRNRFGDTQYFSNSQTYEDGITREATYDTSVFKGDQPELYNASAVFGAPSGAPDPTFGCQGFWSPTEAQWQLVKSLINSNTSDMPDRSALGAPFFYGGDGSRTQIVLLPSVGLSNDTQNRPTAPSFLFIRKRSPSDPAAMQIGAGSVNPIDQPPSFVRQQYVDFLSREPDQDGWNGWTMNLADCGDDAQCMFDKRISVSESFFHSGEFMQDKPALADANWGTLSYNQEYVRQCYLVYLRREPDQLGYSGYMDYLNSSGNDYKGLVRNFIYSTEYRQRFGTP